MQAEDWHGKVYRSGGEASGMNAPRGRCPAAVRDRLMIEQNDCCFYCGRKIGAKFRHKGADGRLRRAWDHFKPYAYVAGSGGNENWILACHVCNGIKSDRLFKTPEEAKLFLREELAGRTGYEGWEFYDDVEEHRKCVHCGKSLKGTRKLLYCGPAHRKAQERLREVGGHVSELVTEGEAERPSWHAIVYGGQQRARR